MYQNLKSEHYLTGDSEIKRILSTKSEIGKLISLKNENNFNMTFLNDTGTDMFNGIFNRAKKDKSAMWLLKNNLNSVQYVEPHVVPSEEQKRQETPEAKESDIPEVVDNTGKKLGPDDQAMFSLTVDVPQSEGRLIDMVQYYIRILEASNRTNRDWNIEQWVQTAREKIRDKAMTVTEENLKFAAKAFEFMNYTPSSTTNYQFTKDNHVTTLRNAKPWQSFTFQNYTMRLAP